MSLLEQAIDNLAGVKQYRGYYMALCPFHGDRKPSLKVKSYGFECLACGERGSLKKLLRQLRVYDAPVVIETRRRQVLPKYSEFMELLEVLDEAHDRLLATERLMWYPRERGIDDMVIPCQIGWKDEWYTFPITDYTGTIRGAVARAGSQVTSENKYSVPDGQPAMLYIPDHFLWRKERAVYITFGILDAISLAKLGFAAATPTQGKLSVDPDWFDKVRKPIYFVPDRGERAEAIRLVTKLGWRGKIIELEYPNEWKDPNDYLTNGGQQLLKKELGTVKAIL